VSAGPRHRLARTLSRFGLGSPARLLLDAHRPLEPLAADLGAALGPLLAAAAGPRVGAADALDDLDTPGVIDRLITDLDENERGSRGANAG
jgi:hypothetical protein